MCVCAGGRAFVRSCVRVCVQDHVPCVWHATGRFVDDDKFTKFQMVGTTPMSPMTLAFAT